MKKFDIENIGKKMPYEAPSERFFESFKSDLMDRVAVEQPRKRRLIPPVVRLFTPIITVAASLLIGLFVFEKSDFRSTSESMNYLVSDNLDASLDSYFGSLSDDELAYLLDNTSSQDDFYLTLPENE